MSGESLNVIALISGGKDSFYSLLHCLENGHRVVALANLFPPRSESESYETEVIEPGVELTRSNVTGKDDGRGEEHDLNSFMYQTVGHEIIPLYAQATGLPLYRQCIRGGAAQHERDYSYNPHIENADETESMIPLLQTIMKRHPEANALCSGAILSTYQRTRVESIAQRLGLTPLAYLWKYTALPFDVSKSNEAQLLVDMADAGLEARIIKVASAGLDESYLWQTASSQEGSEKIKSALRKFGAVEGAALGEGGEFETLVVKGPVPLFKKHIVVPETGRKIIHEGGGSTWVMLDGAHLSDKEPSASNQSCVRQPKLLDAKFEQIQNDLVSGKDSNARAGSYTAKLRSSVQVTELDDIRHMSFFAGEADVVQTIDEETSLLVDQIRAQLMNGELNPNQMTTVIIVLRRMSDFPAINAKYGELFSQPNPPSRVTISCGDLLPERRNIMIHITIPRKPGDSARDGLHVQSRSHWAPANIGPYSQSIGISSASGSSGLKATYVAGQIPLLPASMQLPTQTATSLELQITLSLQHLWRIGLDRRIQTWTSAVAYFARSASKDEMKSKAKLARRAWQTIHELQEDEEEDEGGPDLWDLKYNPEYISLANTGQQASNKHLPDFDIFSLSQQNELQSCIPPVFAVEVEELPRQSAVEWHAHIGLSELEEGSTEFIHEALASGIQFWHQIVRTDTLVFIHSVAVLSQAQEMQDIGTTFIEAYAQSSRCLELNFEASATCIQPYLVYANIAKTGPTSPEIPTIPCHSIWSAGENEIAAVALFKRSYLKQ
ncbi:hypothetical protein VHEMI10497 [[Torrubiella] hemipterigena]|uniref:Diphthine--ammonia ligase n=1 Tax=[Torrubiella] hemipterigena TaxID=1531966 RepID=A0A0A1TS93_9HYPO|nr:hypothetical protein VHEMI10497 [[Torrubiella] hemipterigena]